MDIIIQYTIGSYILLLISLGVSISLVRLWNIEEEQDMVMKML